MTTFSKSCSLHPGECLRIETGERAAVVTVVSSPASVAEINGIPLTTGQPYVLLPHVQSEIWSRNGAEVQLRSQAIPKLESYRDSVFQKLHDFSLRLNKARERLLKSKFGKGPLVLIASENPIIKILARSSVIHGFLPWQIDLEVDNPMPLNMKDCLEYEGPNVLTALMAGNVGGLPGLRKLKAQFDTTPHMDDFLLATVDDWEALVSILPSTEDDEGDRMGSERVAFSGGRISVPIGGGGSRTNAILGQATSKLLQMIEQELEENTTSSDEVKRLLSSSGVFVSLRDEEAIAEIAEAIDPDIILICGTNPSVFENLKERILGGNRQMVFIQIFTKEDSLMKPFQHTWIPATEEIVPPLISNLRNLPMTLNEEGLRKLRRSLSAAATDPIPARLLTAPLRLPTATETIRIQSSSVHAVCVLYSNSSLTLRSVNKVPPSDDDVSFWNKYKLTHVTFLHRVSYGAGAWLVAYIANVFPDAQNERSAILEFIVRREFVSKKNDNHLVVCVSS